MRFFLITANPESRKNQIIYSYIGVQSDKQSEALSSMFSLINNLPKSPQAFEIGKKAILNKIESERITKTGILYNFLAAEKRGIDYDIRKQIYNEVKEMDYETLLKFHNLFIKDRQHNILLVGDQKKINFNNLRKYGKLKEIKLKTLFGF